MALFLAFRPPFSIGGVPGDLTLIGALVGPLTMFDTTALPGDLNFLTQVIGASSLWQFEPDDADEAIIEPVGTLVLSVPGGATFDPGRIQPVQVVPEPATASLLAMGLGLAAVFARMRRARR